MSRYTGYRNYHNYGHRSGYGYHSGRGYQPRYRSDADYRPSTTSYAMTEASNSYTPPSTDIGTSILAQILPDVIGAVASNIVGPLISGFFENNYEMELFSEDSSGSKFGLNIFKNKEMM